TIARKAAANPRLIMLAPCLCKVYVNNPTRQGVDGMERSWIAGIATLLAVSAHGAAAAEGSWYAGASLGQSRTSDDLVANRESTVVNGTVTGSTFDEKDTAVRIFGGYRLTRWLSLEASYSDLGASHLATG